MCVWLWGRKEKIRDYGEKAFFITFKVVKICGKTKVWTGILKVT